MFKCVTPEAGHRIDADGYIEQCLVDDCDVCNADVTTCESGRVVSTNGKRCEKVSCGITGCAHCNSLRECTIVAAGFRLLANNVPARAPLIIASTARRTPRSARCA